ncbi:MAG TPA: DUF1080 domain-containing protein [Acidobacteriota bacterium]|jgi:hypothetical protein|nr:DUF1080 domain-containing protein [Acidobacteriota bacterium]
MKKSLLSFCLSLFLCNVPDSLGGEDQWISLFNGKDLSGWVLMGDTSTSFRADRGTIFCTGEGNYPHWLRSKKEYENFVLRFEYMTPNWCEAGVLIHAPLYGRASKAGIKIHLRHDQITEGARSTGSIYDVLPPKVQAAKPEKQWNAMEVYVEWPILRVTLNGQLIQDVNMEQNDQLRWRLRRGYIGFQDIGQPIRYRNIQIRELPSKEQWISLSNGKDLSGWSATGSAKWSVENGAIAGSDGDGYLVSNDSFSSFEFQVYVRTSRFANGGIQYRWQSEKERGYEAQIYNVIDATNPTGSIYGIVPAADPDARDGEWFLMQVISDGAFSAVFVNGKKVAESNNLKLPDQGKIALQMHKKDARVEHLNPKVKLLSRQ